MESAHLLGVGSEGEDGPLSLLYPEDWLGGEGPGGKRDWRSINSTLNWNYKPQKTLRQGALAPDLKGGNYCCLATANPSGFSCGLQKPAPVSPLRGCCGGGARTNEGSGPGAQAGSAGRDGVPSREWHGLRTEVGTPETQPGRPRCTVAGLRRRRRHVRGPVPHFGAHPPRPYALSGLLPAARLR